MQRGGSNFLVTCWEGRLSWSLVLMRAFCNLLPYHDCSPSGCFPEAAGMRGEMCYRRVKHELWNIHWKNWGAKKLCLANQKPNSMLLLYRRLTERLWVGFVQVKPSAEPSLSLAGVRESSYTHSHSIPEKAFYKPVPASPALSCNNGIQVH